MKGKPAFSYSYSFAPYSTKIIYRNKPSRLFIIVVIVSLDKKLPQLTVLNRRIGKLGKTISKKEHIRKVFGYTSYIIKQIPSNFRSKAFLSSSYYS